MATNYSGDSGRSGNSSPDIGPGKSGKGKGKRLPTREDIEARQAALDADREELQQAEREEARRAVQRDDTRPPSARHQNKRARSTSPGSWSTSSAKRSKADTRCDNCIRRDVPCLPQRNAGARACASCRNARIKCAVGGVPRGSPGADGLGSGDLLEQLLVTMEAVEGQTATLVQHASFLTVVMIRLTALMDATLTPVSAVPGEPSLEKRVERAREDFLRSLTRPGPAEAGPSCPSRSRSRGGDAAPPCGSPDGGDGSGSSDDALSVARRAYTMTLGEGQGGAARDREEDEGVDP